MRDASVQLQARLTAEATTLARLWRVTRRDGTVLRFTDAVRPITIQIEPDEDPEEYRADISFTSSAVFTSKSMGNSQSVTVTFNMDSSGIDEGQLRQRKYDGAEAEIFIVDYEHVDYGVINIFRGTFGTVQLSNLPVAQVEVTPLQASLNGKTIGNEKYSQTCRASLGDTRCGIDIEALKVAFTVDSATGGSVVASEISQPNGHWGLGFVVWLTGPNEGTTSQVQSNNQASTSIYLLSPPLYPITVGDTGEIFPGCDKLRQTCKTKFNNLLNMRAEPDVPDGAGIPGLNYANIMGSLPI